MPRPKTEATDALQYELKTRVNEARYQALQEMLKKSTLHSMSELIRDILDNKPVRVLIHDDSLEQYMESLSSVQKELRSIGVNVNQITKQFNASDDLKHKQFYASQVAEQYHEVGIRVDQLLSIVGEIAKKWLQE